MSFVVRVGRTDDIDVPFVDDPRIVGTWKAVDFVRTISRFAPGRRRWTGEMALERLTFERGGRTAHSWLTWAKGLLLHRGDRTASHHTIRKLGGRTLLFFEWKCGDVTICGRRPAYYVLESVEPREPRRLVEGVDERRHGV